MKASGLRYRIPGCGEQALTALEDTWQPLPRPGGSKSGAKKPKLETCSLKLLAKAES